MPTRKRTPKICRKCSSQSAYIHPKCSTKKGLCDCPKCAPSRTVKVNPNIKATVDRNHGDPLRALREDPPDLPRADAAHLGLSATPVRPPPTPMPMPPPTPMPESEPSKWRLVFVLLAAIVIVGVVVWLVLR